MKVLITGANGFIGSNLCIELLKKNFKVYCVLRKNTVLGYERLSHIFSKIEVIYYEDIVDGKKEFKEIPFFNVCFHLASYGVDYRQQDINEMINGNSIYTINILKFLSKVGIGKVISIGSCFEYGINNGEKINENHAINPQSLYAAAKASSTLIAKAYAKKLDIKLIIARPFGVFGEREGIHKLVPQVIMASIKNTELKLTNGEQIRDYIYIKDLINGLLELAIKDVPSYEEFNICSSNEIKLKEFVLKIAAIFNVNDKLFVFGNQPYRKDEIKYLVGDNSKLKKYTQWKMKYSLEEGLYNTYMWYKEKYARGSKYE